MTEGGPTLKQLTAVCAANQLATYGTKAQLIERLETMGVPVPGTSGKPNTAQDHRAEDNGTREAHVRPPKRLRDERGDSAGYHDDDDDDEEAYDVDLSLQEDEYDAKAFRTQRERSMALQFGFSRAEGDNIDQPLDDAHYQSRVMLTVYVAVNMKEPFAVPTNAAPPLRVLVEESKAIRDLPQLIRAIQDAVGGRLADIPFRHIGLLHGGNSPKLSRRVVKISASNGDLETACAQSWHDVHIEEEDNIFSYTNCLACVSIVLMDSKTEELLGKQDKKSPWGKLLKDLAEATRKQKAGGPSGDSGFLGIGWINENVCEGNQLPPQLKGQIILALKGEDYDMLPGRQPRRRADGIVD